MAFGLTQAGVRAIAVPPNAGLPPFPAGGKTPFLGVFTHVEPIANMADKLASLKAVLQANPYISGIDLKIQWSQLHPAKETTDWDGLESLVATAANARQWVLIGLLSGAGSPDWIYSDGAVKTAPVRVGGRYRGPVPVPWDPGFEKIFLADLSELARRYDADPRVFAIEVQGATYGFGSEEMHSPTEAEMKPYGFTRDVALANWKFWIDRYAELFPHKRLELVISQMYGGGDQDLPRLVADYFAHRLQGRAILATHQLNGREDGLVPSGAICRDLSSLAPNCDEMVGSFKEQQDRQGSPEMTLYNARRMGDDLLYLQIWRRDATDPAYARALKEAWDAYGSLTLEEFKDRLVREGKYRPPGSSTFQRK